MQYLDKPFNQVVFFVVISIFLSFSSNLVRKDSIPLLAKKLEITEDIDLDSDESNTKSYFIGLSTPISTVTILAFMFFSNQINGQNYYGDSRLGLALVCILGLLMLSPIHFPKVPLMTFRSSSSNTKLLIILIYFFFIF